MRVIEHHIIQVGQDDALLYDGMYDRMVADVDGSVRDTPPILKKQEVPFLHLFALDRLTVFLDV